MKQVGRELGVRYVLEGSLRKSGNRVRVTAQLVEAETGNHVWAERYDRDLADIFAVQDEITEAVTIAIAPAIAHAEQQRAMRKPPASLDAWGAYQRGMWHLGKASDDDNALAEKFFQQVDRSRSDLCRRVYRACRRAIAGPRARRRRKRHWRGVRSRSIAATRKPTPAWRWRWLRAAIIRAHVERPSGRWQYVPIWPMPTARSAWCWPIRDEPGEGLAALKTCIRLDPRAPSLVNRLTQVALAHYFCRDYEAAVDAAERAIRSFPDFPSPYRWLAAALGELGRTADARMVLEKAMRVSPSSFDFQVRERPPWFRPQEHAHMLDGLRKAGWEG